MIETFKFEDEYDYEDEIKLWVYFSPILQKYILRKASLASFKS